MTLETLLVTDLVQYFDPKNYKGFRGITAPTECTNNKKFDLMDKKTPFIVNYNNGSVTYNNPLEKTIHVTNYEEFVNSLPKNLQKGKKRCDFLVYQENERSFFILNELSQSRNIDSKESDALYQLQNTLDNLCKVNSIKTIIDSCFQKLCIFSNRIQPVSAPLGMTDGFNNTFETRVQQAVPFEYDDINKYGFEYYRSNLIDIQETVKAEIE